MKKDKEIHEFLESKDWRGLAEAFAEGDMQWHANEWKEFVTGVEGRAIRRCDKVYKDKLEKAVSDSYDKGYDYGYNKERWLKDKVEEMAYEKAVEYLSHDMEFKDEDQRKVAVRMYLEELKS